MTDGVCVVIQARMGSSRLPGKVLQEISGSPMLAFQIGRIRAVEVDHLVVATSDLERDAPIAQLAQDHGVDCLRGPEADVLERFSRVVDRFRPRHVVRLTADCPLSDPGILTAAIRLHLERGVDYTSNVHPRSYPKGLDVEVATTEALLRAVSEATDPYDREHVTPFLYRDEGRFSMANLSHDQDLSHLWWTVDTPADLEHVRSLVSSVPDPLNAPWTDFLHAEG